MHTHTRTQLRHQRSRKRGLQEPGWQGREGRRRSCWSHSVPAIAKAPRCPHCSTCPRVSGSFKARELPRARAAEAKRMGAALVIPTKDVKMLIPSTAASLHRAFRKPKAVVLLRSPQGHVWGRAQEGKNGWVCKRSWRRGKDREIREGRDRQGRKETKKGETRKKGDKKKD